MSKVYFASDHAGFGLKSALVPFVKDLGYETEDLGAFTLDASDDYPDFIIPCAKKVSEDMGSFGVILGGSGQGEAMVANRTRGVRAAVFYGEPTYPQTDIEGNRLGVIQSERLHNDANILSIGARFVGVEAAKEAVQLFLTTKFGKDERHVRRLAKF